MKELELFYMEECPYCHKVMDVIKEKGISLKYTDILADPANKERLIAIGGKHQVPMLLIDGQPLYESSDIINWIEENL